MNPERLKKLTPIFVVSAIISFLSILLMAGVIPVKLDGRVILVANLLLSFVILLNALRHLRNEEVENPHAMVRGVMASVVLKLFVLGSAAFVYLYASGNSRDTNALFVSMGLYILYTWLEVRLVTGAKK